MQGAIDNFGTRERRVRFSRIDPSKPAGIHPPKLPGDIGWDLEAMEDVVIPPMQSVDVPVNARLELPPGVYVDVRNRSSMGRRNLYVDHGLIDTGYRGPLFVLVRNMTLPAPDVDNPFFGSITIKAGERIGQLVFHQATPVWLDEVEQIDMNSDRAEAGFGSTGR